MVDTQINGSHTDDEDNDDVMGQPLSTPLSGT